MTTDNDFAGQQIAEYASRTQPKPTYEELKGGFERKVAAAGRDFALGVGEILYRSVVEDEQLRKDRDRLDAIEKRLIRIEICGEHSGPWLRVRGPGGRFDVEGGRTFREAIDAAMNQTSTCHCGKPADASGYCADCFGG